MSEEQQTEKSNNFEKIYNKNYKLLLVIPLILLVLSCTVPAKIKVLIKGEEIFISPLEMQIAFKLSLGSEKDLEDAKHIYEIFREKLNKKELDIFLDQLNVRENFEKIK